jgi:hypothetical protein
LAFSFVGFNSWFVSIQFCFYFYFYMCLFCFSCSLILLVHSVILDFFLLHKFLPVFFIFHSEYSSATLHFLIWFSFLCRPLPAVLPLVNHLLLLCEIRFP